MRWCAIEEFVLEECYLRHFPQIRCIFIIVYRMINVQNAKSRFASSDSGMFLSLRVWSSTKNPKRSLPLLIKIFSSLQHNLKTEKRFEPNDRLSRSTKIYRLDLKFIFFHIIFLRITDIKQICMKQ